jgi:hypothetical protein
MLAEERKMQIQDKFVRRQLNTYEKTVLTKENGEPGLRFFSVFQFFF